MKLIIGIALVTLVIVQAFGQKDLITRNSISSLELCQSINSIKLPFISDTLFNANGFYFYGRYYGNGASRVLASIDSDSTINGLGTKSSAFKTTNDIKVGSSLNELINSSDSIYVTSVVTEYQDFYLFRRFPDSRIEYRFSINANSCFDGHEILDKDYLISKLDGVAEKASQIGDKAKIISIWIMPTNSCKK